MVWSRTLALVFAFELMFQFLKVVLALTALASVLEKYQVGCSNHVCILGYAGWNVDLMGRDSLWGMNGQDPSQPFFSFPVP